MGPQGCLRGGVRASGPSQPEPLAAQSPGTCLTGWSLGVGAGIVVLVLNFLGGCGLSSSGSSSRPSG